MYYFKKTIKQQTFLLIVFTVKTRVKEPTILQGSLTRFFYIWYLVGNETVQVFKLVLVYSGLFGISFVQIQTSNLLVTVSSQHLSSRGLTDERSS